ncbi:serine/threonine-protein kinase [Spirillospora sp. CA-294931]|uniref:serine/threonine-protein kinase n=1 Tax=Spirillospora sp. CA-294931 TaxID=3240042 RepID=UPI003D91E4F7
MRPLDPGDPRRVEGYRVLARLGSGGMGVVYFARTAGGRAVALKMVHPELADDPEFRVRFRREATIARSVGGGFTAPVVEAGTEAAIPWLATEFVPAVSVAEAVGEFGPLPVESVWTLAAGTAEALVSLHAAGVVHRDLKPANVLMAADGPRVIDFGIARALEGTTLSHTGARAAGSPGFMSPEQVAGGPVGPPSDVFSLGTTLAYACTGSEPFGDGPWHAIMFRVQRERPRLDAIADPGLRELVAACTERDPSRRPTAAALAARLVPRADGLWPPPLIAAEIVRREREAENPPVPGSPGAVRSRGPRVVLAVGAAAAIGVPVALWSMSGEEKPVAPPSPTAAPSTPSPRVTSRTFEFYVSGTARLPTLTYSVDGRSVTLKNVRLPWRVSVPAPPEPRVSAWKIDYRHTRGSVSWRLLVDGFETATGGNFAAGPAGGRGGTNGRN